MEECKPVKVPIRVGLKLSADNFPKSKEELEYMAHVIYANAVGSVLYKMVCTRPNISHVVRVLSRYMVRPRKEHWETIKRVLRYLRGTTDFVICYQGNSK